MLLILIKLKQIRAHSNKADRITVKEYFERSTQSFPTHNILYYTLKRIDARNSHDTHTLLGAISYSHNTQPTNPHTPLTTTTPSEPNTPTRPHDDMSCYYIINIKKNIQTHFAVKVRPRCGDIIRLPINPKSKAMN